MAITDALLQEELLDLEQQRNHITTLLAEKYERRECL
jgi:hypothetical protein